MLIKKHCPKHERKHDADSVFMRRICVHIFLILLSLACLCGTTYALFGISTTTGTNTVKTYDYALSIALDGNTETVYMGSQKTAAYDSVGTHTLIISSLPDAPTGFCIITVEDTDDGGNPRTTNYYTTQLGGDSGSDSLTITLNVLSEGTVTIKPHWGIYSNYDALSAYTAVNGSQIDIGTTPVPVNYNTFTHSDNFANVDTYLYRVGNGNFVALGSLFKSNGDGDDTVASSNVKITVESVDNGTSVSGSGTGVESGSTANCVYTINNSDWTQSTLKFTGEGPVKVTIQEGAGDPYTLNLEVVNAMNTTTVTSATSSNVVLLNNVSGALTVSGGYTLYGNGFTVTDTRDHPNYGNGYVYINNGTADNVWFKGYEPSTAVTSGNWNSDFAPAVQIGEDGANIYNSHISGGRYALVFGEGELYLDNTTLDGGAVGNMQISGGTVIMNNCTTTISTNDGLKGLGINIAANKAKLILSGTFDQHNWMTQSDIPSAYSSILSDLYTSSQYADYRYVYNANTYVNLGIMCMVDGTNFTEDNVKDKIIIDNTSNEYGYIEKTSMGVTATAYTAKNTLGSPTMLEGVTFAPYQYGVIPETSFSYPSTTTDEKNYCRYNSANGQVEIGFEQATETTYYTWDAGILTATKYGNALPISVSVSTSDGEATASGSNITFKKSGSYVITYTYTDPYNYNAEITKGSKTYTETLNVKVTAYEPEAVIYNAVFTYTGGQSTKKQVIGSDTWIMPDVSATSSTIGSTTVSGQTVYYPIVTVTPSASGGGTYSSGKIYNYYPAFTAINITDYNQDTGVAQYTYSNSTTTWPHGQSNSTGPNSDVYGYSGTAPYCGQTADRYQLFGKTNLLGLCYYESEIERNVNANSSLVHFYYVSNDGTTYHYYIKYDLQACAHKSCVAAGTMITMADGTQKPVENLTISDMIMTFDHATGTFVASPVLAIENSGDNWYDVINLEFADGNSQKFIWEHGLFDLTLNKYVYFNADTYADYIGHEFATVNGESIERTTLVNAYIALEYTTSYNVFCTNHMANGMLSLPADQTGLINIFEYGENLKFDEEKMLQDIERYGLYTYEDFAAYTSEEVFNAYGGPYLKVAVGKGMITFEEILGILDKYEQYLS